MVGRRWSVVVVAALISAAVPAVAAPQTPSRQPLSLRHEVHTSGAPQRSLTDLLAAGDTAAVRRYTAEQVSLGLQAGHSAAADAEDNGYESYLQVGDLNGDGTDDLLAQRWQEQIATVSGADGTPLWTRPVTNLLSAAAGAQLGPDAAPGVILFESTAESLGVGRRPVYTFTAFDRGGAELWSTPIEGLLLELPTGDELAAVGLPIGAALGDVDGDGTDDLRVALVDHLPVESTSTVSTVVISGADGTVSSASPDIPITGSPAIAGAPDVDGDGRRELAVLDLRLEASTLWALDGRTGTPRWSAGGLQLYSFYVYDEYQILLFDEVVSSLLDTTGDGVADLRVVQYDRASRSLFTSVLDGASGAVGFTTDTAVYQLGDVVGDAAAEIGTASSSRADGVVTIVYDAVAFDGTVRRHATRALTVGDRTRQYSWIATAGDVDADGITDIEQDVLYGSGASAVRDNAVFAGATMADLWHPEIGLFVSSLDGRGTDHLVIHDAPGSVSLLTRDGETGAALWSRTLGASGVGQISALDLDGDGRASVLVAAACADTCPAGGGIDVTLLHPDGATDWYRRR